MPVRYHPALRQRHRRRARLWTSSVLPPWEAVSQVRPCRRTQCVLCVESWRVGQSLICQTLAFWAQAQALASRGTQRASHERAPAGAGPRSLATWVFFTCGGYRQSLTGAPVIRDAVVQVKNLLCSARRSRRLSGPPQSPAAHATLGTANVARQAATQGGAGHLLRQAGGREYDEWTWPSRLAPGFYGEPQRARSGGGGAAGPASTDERNGGTSARSRF